MFQTSKGPCLQGELPDHLKARGRIQVGEVVRHFLAKSQLSGWVTGAIGHRIEI
jgi:hypothetical protein